MSAAGRRYLLAPGADRIFAEVAPDVDRSIEVVLTAADYRERKVSPAQQSLFD